MKNKLFSQQKNNKFIEKILLILLSLSIIFIYSKGNTIEKQIIQYIENKKNNSIIHYFYEKEIPQIKKYVVSLREGYIKSGEFYKNITKPKISFISTVYNKEKYLKSFICSIQNQNLKEFELIIVDDSSTDNSVEIIKKFEAKDLRIKLVINKKNMGSLYSRCKGALYSKGEYLIFVDSDDIILKEGLANSYNYIKRNNLDMIQFNSVIEINDNKTEINRRCYKYTCIIYQPILSHIYYYHNKRGIENNYNLWDKLIKNQIVLNSLKYIGTKFLHKKIVIENDVVILFALFRNSNSYQYIDELGYYYFCRNNDSITNTRDDSKKANQIIFSIFSNIEFLYDKTERNKFDKKFCIFKLQQGFSRYIKSFKYINNNTFTFANQIINKLLESKYFSLENKRLIKKVSKKLKLELEKK